MNRAIMAQRAQSLPAKPAETRVSRNLALRHKAVPPQRAGVRKSRATKLTRTQRDSHTGGLSHWNASPVFFTDPKWGRTLRDGLA